MVCHRIFARLYGARFQALVYANSREQALESFRRNPIHKRVLIIACVPLS